jgi:hypothetical protein
LSNTGYVCNTKYIVDDDFDYDNNKDIIQIDATGVTITYHKDKDQYFARFFKKHLSVYSCYLDVIPRSIVSKMHTLRRVRMFCQEMRKAFEYGDKETIAKIATLALTSNKTKKLFIIKTAKFTELSYGLRYFPDDDLTYNHTIRNFIKEIKKHNIHKKYHTEFIFSKNKPNHIRYIYKIYFSKQLSVKIIFNISMNVTVSYKDVEENRVMVRFGVRGFEIAGSFKHLYTDNLPKQKEIFDIILGLIDKLEAPDNGRIKEYIAKYPNLSDKLKRNILVLDNSNTLLYNASRWFELTKTKTANTKEDHKFYMGLLDLLLA